MGFVKVANIFLLLEKVPCFQAIYNIKPVLTEQVWESCSTFVLESLFGKFTAMIILHSHL